MAKRQFKTETKRLLDLMINSIYTHKEVFLRELLSNASDALDKLYFASITGKADGVTREELDIILDADPKTRTLRITDNGCGMTQEELVTNLGTIAKSGTLDFRTQYEGEDVEAIGQFGVGFYSAFMISKRIEVRSRAFGADTAWLWKSTGEDGYTLNPVDYTERGTEITLYLKDDTEEENYSRFLEQYTLQGLVKKYSDYIRYPIKMAVEHSRPKEGAEGEYETFVEVETLNSMVPLWKRNKDEATEEEYNNFYRDKFMDFADPARVINTRVEGSVTYNALLYVPSMLPFDYYSKNFEKGLALYSNGVMIMEKCAELLPDHFAFVRGVVDSSDFSLNISREILQHDRQLKLIAKNLEKKIRADLTKMLKDDREKYEAFFGNFGIQLKFGLYDEFGFHKDDLKDLVLFHSLTGDKMVTFKEYVESMPEDQKYIYYACGESIGKIASLPQTDVLKEKGYDILCMTDSVDEFAVRVLQEYDGKQFRSVADGDLGLETDEQKEELARLTEENKGLLEQISKALEGKVAKVRLTGRLKNHPVCLANEGALSLDMEKVLNAIPQEQKVKAERVLELNASHPVFGALVKASGMHPEKTEEYASLLYDQALLMAGMPIDDPVAFSNAVCGLWAEAYK